MDAERSPWRLRATAVVFGMLDDPRPGHGVLGVSDPDVHLVDGRWTMFLGGFTSRFVVRVVEARLPRGADLTDDGWTLVTDERSRAVTHGAPGRGAWDRAGMHTPCYVRGWTAAGPVERIYYAGRTSRATTGPTSRYAIGMLQKRDHRWVRRDAPILAGDAERPSALEPRVLYTDGRWRMWYLSAVGEVGKGEQPDYELRYAESADGVGWGEPARFSTPEEGWFDNAVGRGPRGWQMVLARGTNLHGTSPYPAQGLWWCTSEASPGGRSCWTEPARMLDTSVDAEPWYAAGVCGPSFVEEVDAEGRRRVHVFATGTHAPTSWWRESFRRVRAGRRPPAPSPYYLTTGRLTFVEAVDGS